MALPGLMPCKQFAMPHADNRQNSRDAGKSVC